MVFVGSLSLMAKKVLGSKCHQSSIQGILKTLPIDAAVSGMDVVILGPSDLNGPAGKQLPTAIENRHPSVCVIYLCTNDKEAKLLPTAPHVKRVKRIRDTTISEAIEEFYPKDISVMEAKYDSMADKTHDLGENIDAAGKAKAGKLKLERGPRVIERKKLGEAEGDSEPPSDPPADPPPALDLPPIVPTPDDGDGVPSAPTSPPLPAFTRAEDVIESIRQVGDWEILKKTIDKDSIVRQLILENNEYAGIAQMLEVWDVRIRESQMDTSKSPEEKMKDLMEFGCNRQVLTATYNSMLVDKFISVMQRAIAVCSNAVNARLAEINTAVATIHTQKDEYLAQAISGDRKPLEILTERVIELKNIEGELCELFAFLHAEGMDEIIKHLDDKLPSTNEYINNVLGVSKALYLPGNSVNLCTQMVDALSDGRITLSAVSDKVTALMHTLFETVQAQQSVIAFHDNVISCLKANRVENMVVRDSLLKNCFNMFVGAEHTGLTATVATYAGMLSRQHNTLVIDLSGHAKYDRYGYAPYDLDKFMEERIQDHLVFVTGFIDQDPEKAAMLIEECKNRMTYFQNLIIVLDHAQHSLLDQFGRDALTIAYVTNCTTESLQSTSAAYAVGRSVPNVGQKLVAIDSPVDLMMLMSTLQMDIATTQLVIIPYMRELKRAAIVHQQPHTYGDTLRVFEEAFRV